MNIAYQKPSDFFTYIHFIQSLEVSALERGFPKFVGLGNGDEVQADLLLFLILTKLIFEKGHSPHAITRTENCGEEGANAICRLLTHSSASPPAAFLAPVLCSVETQRRRHVLP